MQIPLKSLNRNLCHWSSKSFLILHWAILSLNNVSTCLLQRCKPLLILLFLISNRVTNLLPVNLITMRFSTQCCCFFSNYIQFHSLSSPTCRAGPNSPEDNTHWPLPINPTRLLRDQQLQVDQEQHEDCVLHNSPSSKSLLAWILYDLKHVGSHWNSLGRNVRHALRYALRSALRPL